MLQFVNTLDKKLYKLLLVSVRASSAVWVATSVHRQPFVPLHLCNDSHLCRCVVQRLCVAVFMHPLHVYERSVGFASCETLGVHFIRHPCLTRKMRVLPPAAPKNSTPLVERGAIFGADGGGRTRTVLLPTDFESVTSANSITSAYIVFVKAHYITIITISQFDYYIIAEKYCQ